MNSNSDHMAVNGKRSFAFFLVVPTTAEYIPEHESIAPSRKFHMEIPPGDKWHKQTILVNARSDSEKRSIKPVWIDILGGNMNAKVTRKLGEPQNIFTICQVIRQMQPIIALMCTNAHIKQADTLPGELFTSLTWDRGKEMADHKRFTLDTDIKVYFCDPLDRGGQAAEREAERNVKLRNTGRTI